MAIGVATAMIGASVIETGVQIVVEAMVDTTTDYIIDGIDDVAESFMPNFENSYMKQFTNQIRMGASTATQARIMSHALKSQNRIEEKIQDKKKILDDKFKAKRKDVDEKLTSKHKGVKAKRYKQLEEQYHREISELEKDGNRIINLRQSAATEANAFSTGTGAIKQGHDGTIQNLKGGANADLTQAIYALLAGMGESPDKTGVNKISP